MRTFAISKVAVAPNLAERYCYRMDENKQLQPLVMRDPRFVAGRETMGQSTSIDIFAILLEEALSKYGPDNFETAPAYYEYGNALFRVAQRQKDDTIQCSGKDLEPTSSPPIGSAVSRREEAALAAERRASSGKYDEHEYDDTKAVLATKQETIIAQVNSLNNDEKDSNSDIDIALEMMENAYAIVDGANEARDSHQPNKYTEWIRDYMPRILTGIGEVLSALNRHPDAADAYLHALGLREAILDTALAQSADNKSPRSHQLRLLSCRRRIVEANTLIVEELLACDFQRDVTTTETKSLLVPAGKVVEYATGYYERARDELQETVFLMGQLQAVTHDMGEEKENVCFAATLVMSVGESLAAVDEALQCEPQKKKSKLS